jgi:hypothetical protein
VEDHEASIRLLRETLGDPQRRHRRLREINRADQPLEWRRREARGRWRRHGEHWTRRFAKHFSVTDPISRRSNPFGRACHHEQIGRERGGTFEYLIIGRAFP